MVALHPAGGGGMGDPQSRVWLGAGKPPVKGPAGSGEALSPTLLAGRSSSAVASQPIALCLLRGRGCP